MEIQHQTYRSNVDLEQKPSKLCAPFKGNPEPAGFGGASQHRSRFLVERKTHAGRVWASAAPSVTSPYKGHGLLDRKFVSLCHQLTSPLKKDGVSPSTNAVPSTVRARGPFAAATAWPAVMHTSWATEQWLTSL
ncbi:hypothetical protein MTO96_003755 [Rhipicephalus appendiculatus]